MPGLRLSRQPLKARVSSGTAGTPASEYLISLKSAVLLGTWDQVDGGHPVLVDSLLKKLLGFSLGVLAAPVIALAQTPPAIGGGDARLHFGPLALQPRIGLTDVGVDTNVFNAHTGRTRDFTATFVPGVDSWLRVGRSQLSTKTSLELIYFQKSRDQRSRAFSQEGRFEVPMARITPFITGAQTATHQRPNAEIDARVRQNVRTVGVGASLRFGARTVATVQSERRKTTFGSTSVLDETGEIGRALNRRTNIEGLTLDVELTPLTTFVVKTELQHERFELSPVRDSDNATVMAGFRFKPFAMISGSAFVGYRRLNALSAELQDYSGPVAAVDASYLWRESTRVKAKVDRNVEYSVDATAPYYVSFGGTIIVTQALGGRWDAVGQLSHTALSYRSLLDPASVQTTAGRNDRQLTRGVGLGYRIGADMRMGVDVNYNRRLSGITARQYEGYRMGGSFTYAY